MSTFNHGSLRAHAHYLLLKLLLNHRYITLVATDALHDNLVSIHNFCCKNANS